MEPTGAQHVRHISFRGPTHGERHLRTRAHRRPRPPPGPGACRGHHRTGGHRRTDQPDAVLHRQQRPAGPRQGHRDGGLPGPRGRHRQTVQPDQWQHLSASLVRTAGSEADGTWEGDVVLPLRAHWFCSPSPALGPPAPGSACSGCAMGRPSRAPPPPDTPRWLPIRTSVSRCASPAARRGCFPSRAPPPAPLGCAPAYRRCVGPARGTPSPVPTSAIRASGWATAPRQPANSEPWPVWGFLGLTAESPRQCSPRVVQGEQLTVDLANPDGKTEDLLQQVLAHDLFR